MGKILVVYFSATGVTRRMAKKIANVLDADVFGIEPVIEYTEEDLKWPSKTNRAFIEMKNKDYRPPVLNKLDNIDEYDTILLGFPVWYYTAPTIVNTFIEENRLNGKNVYVFVTSGATTVDKSIKDLRKTYPNINFIRGRRFNGGFLNREVFEWLNYVAV